MILDRAFPVQHPQKSHTLFPDCLVKSRGDGVEVVREEVAVGVQGQDRRGVTEHRLYGLDVRPAAHRERCRRMSQRVGGGPSADGAPRWRRSTGPQRSPP